MQQESNADVKIKALLIQLKENHDFKSREIAKLIGVSETYLSNVLNGYKRGGKQLLAGLSLLLELEKLKRKPAPKSLTEVIAELQARLNAIESLTAERRSPDRPASEPSHLALNEPVDQQTIADARAIIEAAGGQVSYPPVRRRKSPPAPKP